MPIFRRKNVGIVRLTEGFMPVTAQQFDAFSPFFKSFEKLHKFPRFYQSIIEMAQFQSIPRFYWGIVEECLIIAWRKSLGNFVIMLKLPPISRDGDADLEKSVLEMFRSAGASVQVSKYDMEVYGYTKSDVNRDHKWLDEYVYVASKYGGGMSGGKLARQRNKVNKARKLEDDGIIRTIHTNKMTLSEFRKCDDVYKNWSLLKDHHGMPSAHLQFRKAKRSDNLILTYIEHADTGEIIIWGVTERVGDKSVIITSRIQNYKQTVVKDPDCYIHHKESKYWMDIAGEDTMMNFGAGITENLSTHKKRLNPFIIMSRYKLPALRTVTKDEWHECCPNRFSVDQNVGLGVQL